MLTCDIDNKSFEQADVQKQAAYEQSEQDNLKFCTSAATDAEF